MLLILSQWLQGLSPDFGFLRVFQYITFRAVMAALTALIDVTLAVDESAPCLDSACTVPGCFGAGA